MPGASEEEIFAAAQAREAEVPAAEPEDNRSFLGRAADTVVPMALRVGGAIGGGVLGSAVAPLAGTIAGGAAGAGLGETLAQGYEDWRGLRGTDAPGEGLFSDLNPTQIAVQTALGAVPIVGKAGSLGKTMLSRGLQGAALGGASAVATPLAEGETPTLGGVALGAGLGGALGAGGGALEARMLGRRLNAPKAPVETPPVAPEGLADHRNSGLAFKQFFSDVTNGAEQYRPQAEWNPLLQHENSAFMDEFSKHTGNFDNHIATSIPAFRDIQIRKGTALANTFGDGASMLDIGASEGSFAKAVSALSGGRIRSVALDPNPDMANFFRTKSQVPGAEYLEEAFHQGFDDAGRVYAAHNPVEPYDIVHESMAFQFISPERAAQVAEAKRLMKPGGVFLTEQKVLSSDPEVWKANETLKDQKFKKNYYTDDALAAKQKVVKFNQDPNEAKAVGMVDNMVQSEELESILGQNFKYVAQYYDAGNFKGYAASDDPQKLTQFVKQMGDTRTEFSTVQTPRVVQVPPRGLPESPAGDVLYPGKPQIAAQQAAPVTNPPVRKSVWEDQQAINSASARDREEFARIYRQDPRNQVPRSGMKPGFEQPVVQAEQPAATVETFYPAASPATTSRIPATAASETGAASPSRTPYHPDEVAVNAAALHNIPENGGSTYSLHTGEVSGKPVFSVSTMPGRELVVEGREVSPEVLRNYINQNMDVLQNPENNFGTWFNPADGKTYLDVSRTVDTLEEAMALARQHNQKAIYDHANFQMIDVPPSGEIGVAPAVTRMAGDVAPEFHAVEKQIAPRPEGFKPQSGTKALAIAAPAASAAIPDDPDSKWDDYVRMGLNVAGAAGLGGAALGHVGMSPKLAKTLTTIFKEGDTETKGLTLVRRHLNEIFDKKKANQVFQQFAAKDVVPVGPLEGIDLSKRKPLLNGVVKAKQVKVINAKGKAKTQTEVTLTPEAVKRLDSLFEHAKTLGADWTKDATELTKLIPDETERRMFTRAFAALSPTTPLELNFLQTAVAYPMLRAGASPDEVIRVVSEIPGFGVGNPKAKHANLARAQEGVELSGEKVRALDKGVFGAGNDEVPLDIHFLRAMGAIEEKRPPKLLYEAINRAITKHAMEKYGIGAFDYMAPIWGAMRQITTGDAGGGVAQLAQRVGLDQPSMFTGNTLTRFAPEDFPNAPKGAKHPAAQPVLDPQTMRQRMYPAKEEKKAPDALALARKLGQEKLFDSKTAGDIYASPKTVEKRKAKEAEKLKEKLAQFDLRPLFKLLDLTRK
jgi:SAM-dependent methyltransferase